jgi:hypothetical protein
LVKFGDYFGKCTQKGRHAKNDRLMVESVAECNLYKMAAITHTEDKYNAWKRFCNEPECYHENCVYDKFDAMKLAFLNHYLEKEIHLKVSVSENAGFFVYLNGRQRMGINGFDNRRDDIDVYERDLSIAHGDILLIRVIGEWEDRNSNWLIFEGIEKETGEVIFKSSIDNPVEWVTYPHRVGEEDIDNYVKEINTFYDLSDLEYKGKPIPEMTTYDWETDSFDSDYYNLVGADYVFPIDINFKEAEFVWGDITQGTESSRLNDFIIASKIKFTSF